VVDLVVGVEFGAGDGRVRMNPPAPTDWGFSAIFDCEVVVVIEKSHLVEVTYHLPDLSDREVVGYGIRERKLQPPLVTKHRDGPGAVVGRVIVHYVAWRLMSAASAIKPRRQKFG